jgi:hypothetical protein
MSPLWSDIELARAALANAVARGIIDKRALKAQDLTAEKVLSPVRRIPRRRDSASFAL